VNLKKERIEKLRRRLARLGVEGLIICKAENLFYLSKFTGGEGLIFLTQREALLLVNFCYLEQAKWETDLKVLKTDSNSLSLSTYLNPVRNINLATRHNIISNGVKSLKVRRVGFEEDFLTYQQYLDFKKRLKGIELKPLLNIVEKIREVKEEEEIAKILRAAEITDEGFNYILPSIKLGVREEEIANKLSYFLISRGAERTAFSPIVASGERSAWPHWTAGRKRLERGDLIILDFGAVFQGYCSDFTRTVVLGKASREQKKIYYAVAEAQKEALEKVEKGIRCSSLDRIARKSLGKRGYSKFFGHNLGHGVGVSVHERPSLSAKNKSKLKAGMVLTIEPGIYIPNLGGVRIEDMVLVTKTGKQILTKSPKELIEI